MASSLHDLVLSSIKKGKMPAIQRWIWQRFYNVMSRSWQNPNWRFMNYGFLDDDKVFDLHPDDELERPFIGIFNQAVDGLPVKGARVLEVGSGRGGGCRYIARYFEPLSVTGLDYSPETVKVARKINADTPGLTFDVGAAEKLPYPDASFDLVVNIESSHCYANVDAFLSEVHRVLRPGGWFTFADMRGADGVASLDTQIAAAGLHITEARNITEGVLTALDRAEARKLAKINSMKFLRNFMTEFAGTRGTKVNDALRQGTVVYLARRCRKPQ